MRYRIIIESKSCSHHLPIITLFSLFPTSISQCYTISNQHRVDTATSNYLVYVVHIIDIAILNGIVSTSSQHHLPLITLFSLFTTSISQCYTISNQHRVDTANSNYLVYVVHIIDNAILYGIESKSCRHCLHLITWFSSFTTSTSQCCTTSNQHRVHITYL